MYLLDIPLPQQLTFGDMASPQGQYLHFFHDYIMVILLFILGLVGYILLSAIKMKRFHKYLVHGPLVEFIWTLAPAIILVFIAFPSLRLYSSEACSLLSLTQHLRHHLIQLS